MDQAATDLDYLLTPRHIDEWHEDMGQVLWWIFPIDEAPYIGSPLNCAANVTIQLAEGVDLKINNAVGTGWPGYHEWFTPLPTNEQMELIQSRIEAAINARGGKAQS